MAYSYKATKVNEQGTEAPLGFHYMPDGTLMSDAEHERLYGEIDVEKRVTSFEINVSDLSTVAESRIFTITGEKDAVVNIQVSDSSAQTKFYNFKTRAFTTAFTSENKLKMILSEGTSTGDILFPASASAVTYTVFLFADPHYKTELSSSVSRGNKILHTKTISQVANSEITFTPITAVSAKFASMPTSVTSTASPLQTGTTTESVSWAVSGATTSTNSFGLYEADQPEDNDWYFTKDQDVASYTDTNVVVLDSVTDLCTGMYVTAGSGLSGTPFVAKIDIRTKTITLSIDQRLSAGVTLTFQARGPSAIAKATGVEFEPSDFTLTATQLTTTTRAGGSAENLNIKSSHGISGNSKSTIRGLKVDASDDAAVVEVSTESATLGVIEIASSQPDVLHIAGIKLYIDGTALHWTLEGAINITKYPTSDRIIYFNLDNILTPGVDAA